MQEAFQHRPQSIERGSSLLSQQWHRLTSQIPSLSQSYAKQLHYASPLSTCLTSLMLRFSKNFAGNVLLVFRSVTKRQYQELRQSPYFPSLYLLLVYYASYNDRRSTCAQLLNDSRHESWPFQGSLSEFVNTLRAYYQKIRMSPSQECFKILNGPFGNVPRTKIYGLICMVEDGFSPRLHQTKRAGDINHVDRPEPICKSQFSSFDCNALRDLTPQDVLECKLT